MSCVPSYTRPATKFTVSDPACKPKDILQLALWQDFETFIGAIKTAWKIAGQGATYARKQLSLYGAMPLGHLLNDWGLTEAIPGFAGLATENNGWGYVMQDGSCWIDATNWVYRDFLVTNLCPWEQKYLGHKECPDFLHKAFNPLGLSDNNDKRRKYLDAAGDMVE